MNSPPEPAISFWPHPRVALLRLHSYILECWRLLSCDSPYQQQPRRGGRYGRERHRLQVVVRLLQLCAECKRRPSLILRACPGPSPKVMNERLDEMIRVGILQRTVFGEKSPVEVEDRLTNLGNRFGAIIDQVRWLQEDVDRQAAPTGAEIEQSGLSSAKRHRSASSGGR